MDDGNNIVIVGGGFAGTTLAQDLERSLPQRYRIVLVSDESYTTFNPMLAEVVGASVFPEQVIAPIRQMIRRAQFIMGSVGDVDLARRVIHCTTLAGPRAIAFAHLVLAFGTRANLALVPGMAEHALPLKLVGDALFIRNRVLQRIARIELESDPGLRRRLGRFIVIGGGFSGVEVAGELADYIKSARRYYRRVGPDELSVTIVQDVERLLPELPEALGAAAAKSMGARHIDLRLGERAVRVDADGVLLASGEFISGATVICTIGTRPNPLVEMLASRQALPTQRGRIETGDDMALAGMQGGLQNLWAIGDCALVKNARTGQLSPPTAQFAVAQAHQLAANIVRRLNGQATVPFGYQTRGMIATIGHMKGVAQVYGVNLKGWPAWLLWRALYLMRMPTFGRKLRIFVEWTWGMFFPTDITHLRFTRTTEADEALRRWQSEPSEQSESRRPPAVQAGSAGGPADRALTGDSHVNR
jgi:NADH:ubiquinone reductase (H+-translocating)